jgi:uncharacterized protein with PIN domain
VCEVCGGHLKDLEGQSTLCYCENCGIVYALKDRLEELEGRKAPGVLVEGTRETDRPTRVTDVDTDQSPRPFSSHWTCPDCGTELNSASDSDLKFVIREHVREYHPNRSPS